MKFTDDFKYKTELHAHTAPVSICSDITPKNLIRLYKEENYSSVVITNHFEPSLKKRFNSAKKCVDFYLSDFYKAKEIGEKEGLNVILGTEIRFTENNNDYLVYGIDYDFLLKSYEFLDGTIEDFYKNMKNDKNIIYQAHPMRDGMIPSKFVDGIEGFNMHPSHNSKNGLSLAYGKYYNFPVICGTDFHHFGHECLCGILTKENPQNSFELAKILKSDNYLMDLSGNIVIPGNFKSED